MEAASLVGEQCLQQDGYRSYPLKKEAGRRPMEELTFEEAFQQLEEAVAALQDGQLSLEEALAYFERGMKLAQYCNDLLQRAELRVQQLSVDAEGHPIVAPLALSELEAGRD
jgi:exodeoxyribonuclease VII small subunit